MSRTGRLGLLIALLAAVTFALPACRDDESKEGGDAGLGRGDAEGLAQVDAGGPPMEPLRAEELEADYWTVGRQGVVPERVAIRFDREVAMTGSSMPADATSYSIEPEIDGELRFSDRSTLVFVPDESFKPETTYRISVSKLAVKRPVASTTADAGGKATTTKILEPEKPWMTEFETPTFELVDLSPAAKSEGSSTVELDVVFSAAVEPNELGGFADWTVDGEPVTNVRYEEGYAGNVVRAKMKSYRFDEPAASMKISLVLNEGLPFDDEITAPKATRDVKLRQGPPVRIEDVILKEGNDGFYFHVICDDEASGGTDYYYDQTKRRSYRVSDRCEPDPDTVEETIQISPRVDIRTSPAEAGFRILADLERKSYTLSIKTGMTTVDGGVLRKSFEEVYEVPARSPIVDIPASGRYITQKMWKNLPVRHRNVDQVEVAVRHVPQQNMIFWMSGNTHDATRRTSNLIHKSTVAVEGPPDQTSTDWLNVRKLVGKPKPGVYEINLSGGEQSDAARLLVTDINLVVKRASPPPKGKWSRSVRVWARDMESNAAIDGVTIETIRKSGDVMARCETTSDGGCHLKLPKKRVDPSPPFAIVAKKGEDITYLKYDELKTQLQHVDLHGEPYRSTKPYRGSLYAERGVYRPGETAHVVGVLRNKKHEAPKANMPVKLKVRDPRGRLVRREVIETNEAGVVTLDQNFADLAETGVWRVEMAVADKTAATHTFNVEEFVPERMDVEASLQENDYAFDQRPKVDVEAEYLFGASAQGSRVDLNCRVEPTSFEPDQNADFQYGPLELDEDYNPVTLQTVQGAIGEDGTATLECPSIAEGSPFPTTGRLVANVDVYESGSGRTTKGRATATVHPENYYVGLKSNVSEVTEGKTYRVQGLLVDWKGRPVSNVGRISVDFLNLEGEWTRYYDRDRGDTRWKRHLRPVQEGSQEVKVGEDGSFTIEFTPGQIGDGYMIRARSGNTRTEIQFEPKRRYYWYRGPRETRDRTPRPMAPTSMHVDVPEPVRVDEEHQVTFTAPYKGSVLLTVETDRLVVHEWRKVDAGKNTWSFKLDEFHPNVYVGAFLMKDPHLESKEAFMPNRAFGMGESRVKPEAYTQEVSVGVPKEIEPKSTLTVDVDIGKTDGPAFVTVAAVDEGILSLTDYETPNPLDDIFAKRALGVSTFDTVGWTLSMPPEGQSSTSGGGTGRAGAGRIMPVEPVALWSGLQKVPMSGKTTVRLEVPRYRGELRVMAHAFTPKRVGFATDKVKVRDPLPVQATTPRFLTADDQVQVPVFVTNMTGRNREVTVSLKASEYGDAGFSVFAESEPLISVDNAREQTISVENGESGTVVFKARANRLAGAAKFVVEAKSGKYVSIADSIVPFRSAGPQERRVHQIQVEDGTTNLNQYLTGWQKTSEQTTFWLTNLEHGRSFDKAKRLIRYPYGCVEQTTSTTRPMLFISQFLRSADPATLSKGKDVDEMVDSGISRILSMQTPDGGIGYWPGAHDPHPWGTTYAAHMLMDAREEGYDVPKDRLDDALDWLEKYAENDTGDDEDYYTHLDTNGRAYMHYVLARSGRGNKAKILDLIDELPSDKSGEEKEADYLLKAALFQAGDRRFEKDLKTPYVDTKGGGRQTGGSFYSHARRRAFILNIFQELFGNDDAAVNLVQQVAEDLQEHDAHYYSTQELVWAVTGLGKWYSDGAAEIADASLKLGGETVEPVAAKDARGATWSVARASEFDSVAIDVDKEKEGKLYLIMSSEGVRTNPTVSYGGNGLRIEREYVDREGDPVRFGSHALGDVVYTKVTVENTSDSDLRNIALVDRFAAGWEVENPRLSGANMPDWYDRDEKWNVDYMNIRDDRVEFFGDLEQDQTATIVYSARATLAGEYSVPPISAEAMYDPTIWARERGRRIAISGPWSKYID